MLILKPSELNLASLRSRPLDARAKLPKGSAIYFAIDAQNKIQYIGKAKNLRQRWSSHHRYSQLAEIGNVRIAYLLVRGSKKLYDFEKSCIAWFKPLLNGTPMPFIDQFDNEPPREISEDDVEVVQAIAAIKVNWVGTAIHGAKLPVIKKYPNFYFCLEPVKGRQEILRREVSVPKEKATLISLPQSDLPQTYRYQVSKHRWIKH